MSTFDKGKQWKAALALLQAMENAQDKIDSSDRTSEWALPAPNVYTYASVISSCARGGQYDEAIRLLDKIRSKTSDTVGGGEDGEGTTRNEEIGLRPNSWIYNSALAACVPPMGEVGIEGERRFDTAIQILHRMENDAKMGFDTLPDAVTYNTLLSTVRGIEQDEKLDDEVLNTIGLILDGNCPTHEQVVVRILETMREKGIPKDAVTYRNAISACYMHPESAERILNMALEDSDTLERVQYEAQSEFNFKEDNILYLINAALTVCGNGGNMKVFARVFNRMKHFDILADFKSMLSLIRGISASGNCEDSMIALNAMKGDGAANEQLVEKYGIDIIKAGFNAVVPMIEEQHYSTAIAGCLRDGQLFPALKILNAMKMHDLKPNSSSLQGIILAYCKLATDEASTEFKEARKEYSKGKARGPFFKADHTVSRTRASAALAMMNTMIEIPIKLKCVVASACAATGMWVEAREILWSLHIAAVLEKKREKYVEITDSDQGSAVVELPKLHRSLLKLCARSGNVTAALWFVDTIQDLKCKFDDGSYSIDERPSTKFSIGNETEILDSWDIDESSISSQKYGIGMTGESWKLLMIAASKSAHWKVCLGTLAFIQPFIEATNPANASTEEGKGPTMKSLNREYENLSRALTAAVLALEIRGQYAWALRAIDDWIEWGGRRPAKEAVFSACRILAVRGIGSEVVALVNKVINIKGRRRRTKILTYDTSYEMAVYTEAITALHNRGLYESADELYVNAISKGFLPFSIMEQSPKSEFKVDLHGMNRAIAHSAVRVSLQHFIQSKNKGKLKRDVLIVTGKGSNSQKHLRPVIRPAVQRMLVEEFYPPISTSSLPNNMGALRISADDANAWIEHQEDQKGARFLAVADVLKTLTSGSRLKTLLSRNIKRFPTPSDDSSK
jgi:pentatricopeptide repeat protein